MVTESPSKPDAIGRETLSPVVRRILADPVAEVVDFTCQEVTGGYSINTSLYRYSGMARVGESILPWQAILKCLRPIADQGDPRNARYWKREALAYQSGLLDSLPAPLNAPRCYAFLEFPDGETWLWLENLTDTTGQDWPLARYVEVAFQLGQFNAAYATGREPLPDQPWILRDWLRTYVNEAEPAVRFIRKHPDHPLVNKLYPGILRGMILATWAERNRMLDALDALPQTFCHQDAYKGNLFCADEKLVAIDWSYPGPAPLGAEIVPLVLMAFSEPQVSQVKRLDELVMRGYLRGLAEGGCRASRSSVRLAFCLTMVLRYVIGANVGQMFTWLLAQESSAQLVGHTGTTGDEMVQGAQETTAFTVKIFLEGLRRLGPGSLVRVLGRGVLASRSGRTSKARANA